MVPGDETCWTVVRGAAAGDAPAREAFAGSYLGVVRAYLGARWRGTPYFERLEDAVQDVFLDCFRDNGALGRVREDGGGNFRTFLYAVVRNVARRHEERIVRHRETRSEDSVDERLLADEEARLSLVYDRAWARTLLRKAVERMDAAARAQGPDAQRRVEILRLRFSDDLPIREIARRFDEDAARIHREYARAREEFKRALADEVAFHRPGTAGEVERECASLLALLKGDG